MKTLILATITSLLSAHAYYTSSIIQPEFTDKWRATYSVNVVPLLQDNNEEGDNHGGTGFFVKDRSGRSHLVTANHVCEYNNLFVNGIKTYAIRRSKEFELCELAFPVQKKEAFDLGEIRSRFGIRVALFGSPGLRGITMTTGEIFAQSNEVICLDDDETHASCPKLKTDLTNIPIMGGMSGGPAVNWFGEVVGVVIAFNTESHWAYLSSLENINSFLNR